MVERIAPGQFHDSEGVDDWRVLWSVAFALYRTGDFATGLKLLTEIGRLAEMAGHYPDLNLRPGVLEVRCGGPSPTPRAMRSTSPRGSAGTDR